MKSRQPNRQSSADSATDLDVVAVIARALKDALPSVPMDLALRYAEKIAIALQREGYLSKPQ